MKNICKVLCVIFALCIILTALASCGDEQKPPLPDDSETGNNGNTGGNEQGGNTSDNNQGGSTGDDSQGGSTGDDQKSTYTITWKDENGTVITTSTVTEGDVPSFIHQKASTAEWSYTFDGWCAEQGGEVLTSIPAASADASYFAHFTATKRNYTVSFVTNGGSAVSPITVEYGALAKEPDKPEYDGHSFVGWYSDAELTVKADFTAPVTGNLTLYAAWNNKIDLVALLRGLLSDYKLDPYSYLPETMKPTYEPNLVAAGAATTDYSSFVNVANINAGGFGEQWQMILDNINESQTFFKALTVVEGLSTTSIAAFNNYWDQNSADTAHHSFKSGIYTVTIDFDGEKLNYVLDYNSVQICLSTELGSTEKHVRIQLSDANALCYTVTENSYEFAIKYLGVRRAYFKIEKQSNGDIVGHIYEYLTVSSVEIASAADFYIGKDYVSAIGNKASGMIGFKGYISELYNVKNGKLLGYEVMETQSKLTFNTLWFDLNQIDGINSIKYREASDEESSAFFIDGSSKEWTAKRWATTLATSRRFDIEFRTQYFYSYDAASDKYTAVAVKVPMLFVQEEDFGTLSADIKEKNGVTVTVLVENAALTKLLADYDTLIPTFIENKGLYSVEAIIALIGEKVSFATSEE